MHRLRPTWAEVNLGNLAFNMRSFRRHVPPPTRLMAVVKANGYGHGAAEAGRAALAAGADWLAVALVEEGIRLRQEGLAAPILILGYLPPEGMSLAIHYRLTPAVADLNTFLLFEAEARRQRRKAGIHLKIDTGMGRLGPRAEDSQELIRLALSSAHLELEGVFTHFATADEKEKAFTLEQLDKFKEIVETIKKEKPQVIAHCANSAAAIEVPQSYLDMVRIGISLYGLYPSAQVQPLLPLKPVMSLHTAVAFIKDVPKGAPISYGGVFVAPRPSRIATLPIGYADGLFRTLSGKAHFLTQGVRIPQVGRICMDYCMADVTDVPGITVGEQVVIFGSQGQETISADELARLAGTISYEILCAVSARVPRHYLQRS